MVEVDGIENLEFKWGKKRGTGGINTKVQFYESFTYDGIDYTLYDNVYLHKEGEPLPYLGKLIKIWETDSRLKKVKVLWFFQPSEISNYLFVELAHPNEVFLASGEGVGLANINPLEAIAGKCNVVCISKDGRNPQPSDEDIQMADYVFYRTFDVGQRIILDKIDGKIAGIDVKFIFNQSGSLKPCSIHNFSVDEPASENAIETNGRVVVSKLNSSENQISKDDRQVEQKPVVAENGFNHKAEENSDVKASSVKPNLSLQQEVVAGVVSESGELAKTNDRSGDRTGLSPKIKANADSKLKNPSGAEIGCVNQVKSEEKLKSVKDTVELDERPHKKAKLDNSVKVSSDKETTKCATEPCGTATIPSKKLKIDDKLKKSTNCKSPAVPSNDGIKTGDKAMEVTRRPDSDRSKWFGELPWEESLRDAHGFGKLVLFQNLDPAYSSAEVEDIVWNAFNETCRAKVVQQTAYSSPHFGQAFAIFKSREVAEDVIKKLDERCLLLPNRRPLVASIPNPCFSRKQSMFAGHLIVDKLKSQREMKEAVSTSHSSQPNTVEYDMAMEWFLMTERSNQFWKKLYEQQGKELKKLRVNFKSK
ncbi:hypothetical protein ES319_D05G050500v1 [Gossypium barbadense]|uniref:BAH domain-containing protein n=3 Tax=Gossypium TaxID=3633 RepID=A0A5J5R9T3_GOSBA|nr:hypothetical protein ES319_D05G050500v1 [Gossypium barbadense]KAB2027712.1 hypothetical protein ES319_D05G050500v1 [Gossypium barbadense]TYG67136.1 hypothetical protein ES288_D05G054200v1 [Gossypium darwinii]TYG67137.1 hypothetical protein ES288_D05G054200v1 [Gossypium darwinii]